MRKLTLFLLLFPTIVLGQAANQFRQVTFSNLGVPNDNNVRYVVDAAIDPATGNCIGGGFGAYAFRVQTGAATFVWRCSVFAPGGGTTGDVTSDTSSSTVGQATIFSATTGKQVSKFTSSGWVKATGGVLSTVASINAATDITGNLPVTNLNGGTNASSGTFWRGDGTWAVPTGAGTVTSVAANNSVSGLTMTVSQQSCVHPYNQPQWRAQHRCVERDERDTQHRTAWQRVGFVVNLSAR
jgi:hypothetical protein